MVVNNVSQLKSRLKKQKFLIYPAVLEHYSKVYTGYSNKWNSSVANICYSKQSRILGSLIYLSNVEVSILDTYEPQYIKQYIKSQKILL
jgi:hypothetical protein